MPANRSGVLRVGSIRAVMNREYEATITSTGNDAHCPVPVGIRAGGNQRSHWT
jgi:hypothetical protein